MKSAPLIALAVMTAATAASAQLADENLLVAVPPGYKVGYRVERGNMVMNEMVPAGQTVENWTEMLTVQIFHGVKAPPASDPAAMMHCSKRMVSDFSSSNPADGSVSRTSRIASSATRRQCCRRFGWARSILQFS